MRTHVLTVADRDISTDDRLLYRGTKDEDRVSLVLDDEWDGLDILVAFKGSDVVSAPAKGADGYYVIPWEIMTKIGDVFASIEGTNADGQVLLHAAMSKPFRVIETGAGFKGYEPTCDLITEAIKESKEAASTAMASSEAADASAAKANAAAGAANASAANADTSAHAADEAAEMAAQAASSANTAKEEAVAAAGKADAATTSATEAAAKANASVITDVDVTTLGPGSEATVSTVKGESGQAITLGIPQGPKGDKGEKGDPFTYNDFTEDQIAGLQRPATEAAAKANASVITDVDVTTLGPGSEATVSTVKGESGQAITLGIPQGPKGDKGEKGDPFTYNDFTEDQIAGLQRPATEAAAKADKAAKNANDAADTANAAAKAVELAATGLSGVQMRALVRTGDAPKVLYPGDLITTGWTWNGTTYPMRMVVAHHYTGADDAHPLKELGDGRTGNCMDLQFIDALPIAFYFEPKQAFYNNVELMSAGRYTFTVSVSSIWGTGAFGTVGQFPYTFTLAKDVPADSQWLWDAGSSSGITQIQIYAPYDGALLQTVTVAAGSTGTSLGTISELATGDFNAWARSCVGSNFWKDSAMRAWLNSDSADWDSRRTRFTRKHPMAGKPGFLAGLEQSLRDGMASVKAKTEPHQTDGAAPVETVDLVRLPSSIEQYFNSYLGQSTEGFKAEGVAFDYWKAVAAANNHPDVIVGWQKHAWLIARDPSKVAHSVFTRSAHRSLEISGGDGMIYASGSANYGHAATGNSCLPVLSIA